MEGRFKRNGKWRFVARVVFLAPLGFISIVADYGQGYHRQSMGIRVDFGRAHSPSVERDMLLLLPFPLFPSFVNNRINRPLTKGCLNNSTDDAFLALSSHFPFLPNHANIQLSFSFHTLQRKHNKHPLSLVKYNKEANSLFGKKNILFFDIILHLWGGGSNLPLFSRCCYIQSPLYCCLALDCARERRGGGTLGRLVGLSAGEIFWVEEALWGRGDGRACLCGGGL